MATRKQKPSKGYENWIVFYPQQEYGRMDYWRVAELHKNGECTIWDYAMFGAIGSRGRFKTEAITKPVTNKAEREEVERVKQMITRGVERSRQWYECEKAKEQIVRE